MNLEDPQEYEQHLANLEAFPRGTLSFRQCVRSQRDLRAVADHPLVGRAGVNENTD